MRHSYKKIHSGAVVRFYLITTLYCSFAQVLSPAYAQTIFGQNGTLLGPSADTYSPGNFMLSGYFRSLSYGDNRFDVTPIGLVTGIAPRIEMGFSFPAIWGGTVEPGFSDDYAQLSLKYRFRGKNEDPWRISLAGLLQRGMYTGQQNVDKSGLSAGFELISSHNFYSNFNFHFYGGGVFTNSSTIKHQGFAGAGFDRFIASRLQFISDIMAASDRSESEGFSLQALTGLRYYPLPNLHITAGGGVGLGDRDFDWQYMVGITLTSDFRQIDLFEGQDEPLLPPPLELLQEDIPPPTTEPPGLTETSEPEEEVWAGELEMASRLFFDFAKFRLGSNEQGAFSDLRAEVAELGEGIHLRLVGHADFVGGDRENLAWGIARAINVASLFHTESGVSLDRFLLTSSGEIDPTDIRTTQAATQLNRRVVVRTWHDFETARNRATAEGRVWSIWSDERGGNFLTSTERLATLDALREAGIPDSTQALLLEAAWEPDADPWPALQRVAALWLFIVSNSSIPTDRIFLHLQPDLYDLPREEPDYPTGSISVESLNHVYEKGGQRLSVKLKNLAGPNTVQEGRIVLVADFPNGRITSSRERLALNEEPNPEKGRSFRFRWQINPAFQIPIPEGLNPHTPLSLYIYDIEGTLVQRTPIYNRIYEERWIKNTSRAWGNIDVIHAGGVPLEIRLISLEQ